MATIVLKNVTEDDIYLRDLSDTIEAGETVTVERFLGELTAAKALNEALANGSIQLVSTSIPPQEAFWVEGGASVPPFVTTAPLALYVSTAGDDTNNGLAATAPLRTVTAALKKVPFLTLPGHPTTINLAAGVYDERIDCPAFVLQDNVTVLGAAMTPTTPGAGIASGTFDVSFGTQAFPHRAVVTGAGWTAGGLTGGWFIEILSGSLTGSTFPIVNNGATTLDVAFPCNTGTFNLQGLSFRLVKPSVTFTRALVNEPCVNANAPIFGQVQTSVTTGTAYLTFQNIAFQRSTVATIGLIRQVSGAWIRYNNCSFLDNAAGGGILLSVQNQAVLRLDDCLTWRSALRNNTNLLSLVSFSTLIANRYGSYGGNFAFTASTSCSTSVTNGFWYGHDVGCAVGSDSRGALNNVGIDAPFGCASITDWGVLTILNCTFKNALTLGVMAGFQGFGGSYATSSVSGGTVVMTNTVIDNCVIGIILGANVDFNVNTTSQINNCTSFGVNMAATLRSSHNTLVLNPSVSMTGNAADLTVNGVTTYTLAAFRALAPKRVTDTDYLNRLVEV